ncbi:MAG: GDP-mannose 4,6-dehydratase [Solirubrobacteraceae bacterium]
MVLERDASSATAPALADVLGHVELTRGDVRDAELMRRVVGGADLVFHLAGQALVRTASRSPAVTFDVNVRGTWTVLEACLGENVSRVVLASSQEVYGPSEQLPFTESQPLLATSPYGASKAAAEVLAGSYWRTYGLPVCITRMANTYGGGDMNFSRLVPEAVLAVLAGRRPHIRSDGTSRRDFLYVEDAVRALLALADAAEDVDGRAFNVGGGEPAAVLDVVRLVCEAAGAPFDPLIGGAPPADQRYLDCSAIEAACGFRPEVSLEQGLARTWAWYASHPGFI